MWRQDFAPVCRRAALSALVALVLVGGCRDSKESKKDPAAARTGDDSASDKSDDDRPCSTKSECQTACARCGATCADADADACLRYSDWLQASQPLDMTAIADAYRTGCAGGHMESCAALGLLTQDGRGVPRDLAGAEKLYRQACDGGRGVGCFNLGLMYTSGTGGTIDKARADQYFSAAAERYWTNCQAGELAWCMNLGVMFENGFGTPPDPERAAALYRDACERGHGDSCANFSLQELSGRGVPENPVAAVGRLRATCAGEREFLACGVLGQVVLRGAPGVARDPNEARKQLTRACDGGVGQSCLALAGMYGLGDGVARDETKELAALKRACDLGKAAACRTIAEIKASRGPAGSVDAREYFQRACNIGHGEACVKLAAMLVAAQPDPSKASPAGLERVLTLMSDGCRLGSGSACYVLIERGRPLPLPERRALITYESACREGIPKACDHVRADGL